MEEGALLVEEEPQNGGEALRGKYYFQQRFVCPNGLPYVHTHHLLSTFSMEAGLRAWEYHPNRPSRHCSHSHLSRQVLGRLAGLDHRPSPSRTLFRQTHVSSGTCK